MRRWVRRQRERMAARSAPAGDLPRPPPRHLPGAEGLMVFVLLDMLFFALLFAAFSASRVEAPDVHVHSQRSLNATLGMLNTFVLLTSSWWLALAVQAHAAGRHRQMRRGLAGTIALGLLFIMIKAVEYHGKLSAGITPRSNEFFTWYYVMTGLHFLHVLVGVGVLSGLWWQARPSAPTAWSGRLLESAGIYWHMVDLLWVLLFPLLYLL